MKELYNLYKKSTILAIFTTVGLVLTPLKPLSFLTGISIPDYIIYVISLALVVIIFLLALYDNYKWVKRIEEKFEAELKGQCQIASEAASTDILSNALSEISIELKSRESVMSASEEYVKRHADLFRDQGYMENMRRIGHDEEARQYIFGILPELRNENLSNMQLKHTACEVLSKRIEQKIRSVTDAARSVP